MRSCVRCVRISEIPPPRDRHTGIPTGHPNSTVLISSPMSLRSSGDGRLFSHSRSGSPPASVRKKIAGTRLPCVPSVGGDAGSAAGAVFRFAATYQMYHIRYTRADSKKRSTAVEAGTRREAVVNVRYRFVSSVETCTDTRAGFKCTLVRVHRVTAKRAS